MAITQTREYLTIREVQDILGVGKTLLWSELQAGNLGYVRLGERAIRIPRAELDRYIEQRTHGRKPRESGPRAEHETDTR